MTLGEAYKNQNNNFNFLRIIAALAVIYGHSYPLTNDPGQDIVLHYFGYKFAGGIAVDMFFVISGFLVCSVIAHLPPA